MTASIDPTERGPLPKLGFSCYLLRRGLPYVEAALRAPYRPGGRQEMAPLEPAAGAPEGVAAYFSAQSQKIPPWAKALKPIFPGLAEALNMSNRLVLFLPVGERTFAVCFGYGSSTLEWSAIEANFGLRFAARRLNSRAVRELRSRRVDASSRTQSVQLPFGSDIKDLDLALEGEFVRRLAGTLDTEGLEFGDIDAIAATDAIMFKTQIDLARVQHVLAQMLREVEEREARDELQFVDSLEPLRASSEIANQLDQLLADRLFDGLPGAAPVPPASDALWSLDSFLLELSPPDGVDTDNVEEVNVYRGERSTRLASLSLQGLRDALVELGGRFSTSALKSIKVMPFNGDGEPTSQYQPLRNWLVFEAGNQIKRYILTLGRWFSLREDYTRQLNSDLARIEVITDVLGLPDWPGYLHEGPYNAGVANKAAGKLVCLDTVDLRPEDGDEVEACDLLHEDGYLIHVKRYNGSQTLSHLFSQGLVSAQLLAGDPTYHSAFVDAVSQRSQAMTTVAEQAPQAVTYAIGFTGNQQLPDDLPSFSKVNLRDFAKRLRNSRVQPTLCRIQITSTA